MKPAVLTLVIALLTAAVSFPAGAQDYQQQFKTNKRSYSLKSSSYKMGMYSRMLNDMISGALRMDLTEEQKTKVSKLRDDYQYPMTKDESTLRGAKMNILKMLENPAFDPAKVKDEIGKSNELDKKLSDTYVDGLVSLRGTIGEEKYEELTKSVNRYRDNLVQMRKKKQIHQQTHDVIKGEPVKTSAPAVPSPDSKK
jgi:Spy/CpxP family protein refolding chaperone